jgi:hypothetical protein
MIPFDATNTFAAKQYQATLQGSEETRHVRGGGLIR